MIGLNATIERPATPIAKGTVNGKEQRVLVVQDNLEEKAEFAAMEKDVSSDVTVLAAKANQKQKELELAKTQDTFNKGASSDLELAKAKNPKCVVIVQADKEVQHGRVTEVLDLARQLGLEQLAIATEASE